MTSVALFEPPRGLEELADQIGHDVLALYANQVDREARFPRESVAAFRQHRLLGAYVPVEFGGGGVSFRELCELSERFGHYCASSAMIFAMHQIQVACLVHHAANTDRGREILRDIAGRQSLLASATTEAGTGGDLGSSVCAAEELGDTIRIDKQAPVISYAEDADAILVTCRAHAEATPGDQIQVLVERTHCRLEPISGWDTMGFRGTCSSGYRLLAETPIENVLPAPFATILGQTMQPVSHLLWGSLWLGMAQSAASTARRQVRNMARKGGVSPTTHLRLAEMDEGLHRMRSALREAIDVYQEILRQGNFVRTQAFSFGTSMNNIKLICSEGVVDVVSKAMVIAGISAYRNDSESSLARVLRDAYGTLLMVNNDRIRSHNAAMQLAQR
jgi:acyl-CoA dehydrogenase